MDSLTVYKKSDHNITITPPNIDDRDVGKIELS